MSTREQYRQKIKGLHPKKAIMVLRKELVHCQGDAVLHNLLVDMIQELQRTGSIDQREYGHYLKHHFGEGANKERQMFLHLLIVKQLNSFFFRKEDKMEFDYEAYANACHEQELFPAPKYDYYSSYAVVVTYYKETKQITIRVFDIKSDPKPPSKDEDNAFEALYTITVRALTAADAAQQALAVFKEYFEEGPFE